MITLLRCGMRTESRWTIMGIPAYCEPTRRLWHRQDVSWIMKALYKRARGIDSSRLKCYSYFRRMERR